MFLVSEKHLGLEWLSQSPHFNPIEMLWRDLKQAVHSRVLKKLTELKTFAVEEWAIISVDRCRKIIESYKNRLVDVIAAKAELSNTNKEFA